jgi:uncharacterized protein YcbX
MRVRELWRYPVKSMQGEQLDRVDVMANGLTGDRAFALFDTVTGYGLTARRVPELLFASARYRDGGVEIVLPGGQIATDDVALSAWLGRPVVLRPADAEVTRTYEVPLDVDTEAEDSWVTWNGPRGAFHDSTRARVSLVSTGTLDHWDARRFRANVVLDGAGEDALVGTEVLLGTAVLTVQKQIDRCVMVTRPQPGGVARDLEVLKTINHERGGFLAVGALVDTPGVVQIGDRVERRG